MKVEMSEVVNGRFGMDVWILDERQKLVARSWHTALIMGYPFKNQKVEGGRVRRFRRGW